MSTTVLDRPSLLVLVAVLTGCSLSGAPADSSAARGVLITTIGAPLDETWVATRAALESLRLRPYDLERGSFSAVIVGDTAEGKEIRVNLKTVTRSTTEVTIRIVGSREREAVEEIRKAIVEHL
jgi:hypothetical protein